MANSLKINSENTGGLPPDGVSSPATYRQSENVPSAIVPLAPVPRFPKLDDVQPSSTSPAQFHGNDHAAPIVRDGEAVTLDVRTKQQTDMSPLAPATRFDPKLMRHVPVVLPPVDDAKPVQARPVHDVSKAQNR